jgi:hypothetical protein
MLVPSFVSIFQQFSWSALRKIKKCLALNFKQGKKNSNFYWKGASPFVTSYFIFICLNE